MLESENETLKKLLEINYRMPTADKTKGKASGRSILEKLLEIEGLQDPINYGKPI